MKSICFFPFTRMSQDQVLTMDLFFHGVKVLNLDPKNLSEPLFSAVLASGGLNPVSVGEDKISMLKAQVRSFMEWAAVHKGNEKNLKSLIREETYFRNDSDVTAIQSDIRQGIVPGATSKPKPAKEPALFLRFAEILDRENEIIQDQLDFLEQNNASLFAELKGEIEPGEPILEQGRKSDPGADRTGERIQAWCAVAREIGLFDSQEECPVLVTTSPAVLDYLTGNFDEVINGLDNDCIKVHEHVCGCRERWQKEFSHFLEEFIVGQTPSWNNFSNGDCNCRTGIIRLSRFPGGGLNKKFNIPGTQVVVCLVTLNS